MKEENVKGLARNDDPDTSHEAAESVDASKLMGLIYEVIDLFGEEGCTSDEVMEEFDAMLPARGVQTISPRFKQMVDRGMIEVLDEKRKGSRCGRMQQVRRTLPPPFIPIKVVTNRRKNVCVWTFGPNQHYEVWDSTCGIEWNLESGTPHENEMNYCPSCGGKLIEAGNKS
jgi:hypothetical protein